MSEPTITIFDEEIPVTYEKVSIYELNYFEENPRVFSCIHGEDAPKNPDTLQNFIEKKMLAQPSVENLIPTIREHGGLHEHILVRYDTKQVVDGNSRLAAFRKLHKSTKDNKWSTIPCNYVTSLTEEQQDAYLSQIHIRGETPWSAYEKANFAYIRNKNGVSIEEIAHRSSITVNEIKKRIKVVGLMEKNNDKEQSHFSYYDVLVRTRNINEASGYTTDTENSILLKIKNMGVKDADDNYFTAQDLRRKLPDILKKKKALKKFIAGESTMDEAYQNARPSDPLKKVKTAKDNIVDILKEEITHLEKQDTNDLLHHINKLSTEVERIKKMTEQVQKEKQQNA